MLRSMYSGISGMKANQAKLDVIGNNIANVSTTSFKASSARFSDMLYQNSATATSPTSNKGGTNAQQVGLGAKLASIDRIMSQGNALSTGRSLDVCIDGEGYFIVGSGIANYGDDGGNPLEDDLSIGAGGDMSINYTRDGNFKLDYEGNLITADGYRVMGYLLQDGDGGAASIEVDAATGEKKFNYVDADGDLRAAGSTPGQVQGLKLQPLMIPDEVIVQTDNGEVAQKVQTFTIGRDGVITAVLADGSRTALGQIAMASFKNPEGLTSVGGNLYEASSNSGEVLVKTPINIDDANTKLDNSKGFGEMIQGCLEASNVDLTEQFTDMITATRAFQASSKMISTGDEILQTITSLVR